MNKKYIIAICIIAILFLAGWYFKAWNNGGGDEIQIGGAFGLSGICAEWGEGELKAAQMAADEAHIKLIVEDTQCENKTTVNAINKLIYADGVQAIVGPTWGDSYQG